MQFTPMPMQSPMHPPTFPIHLPTANAPIFECRQQCFPGQTDEYKRHELANFGTHITSQLNIYINNASYFLNRNEQLNLEILKLTQESEAMKKKLDQSQSILAVRDKALGQARREILQLEQKRLGVNQYKADCERLERKISDKTKVIALKERNIATLHRTLKRIKRENEQYRFAAMSLKQIAVHLPSARINAVEWQKGNISDHMTIRSQFLHQERELVLSKVSKTISYIIENNPLNVDNQNSPDQLEEIKNFVDRNNIGNVNPRINLDPRKCKSKKTMKQLDELLGIRVIKQCDHLPILVGQKETFAKVDIKKGTIIGQYVGNEMSQEEYHKIYNGTKEEMDHLTYMMGYKVKVNGKEIELYIDGYAACKSSPLLFINDGRTNMRVEETGSDSIRMNTEYVSVLCNGWPMMLVRITKDISAGDSLWINYGPSYGLVLDMQALMYDQKMKSIRSVEQILTGVDLKEQKPLDLSSVTIQQRISMRSKAPRKMLATKKGKHSTDRSKSPRKMLGIKPARKKLATKPARKQLATKVKRAFPIILPSGKRAPRKLVAAKLMQRNRERRCGSRTKSLVCNQKKRRKIFPNDSDDVRSTLRNDEIAGDRQRQCTLCKVNNVQCTGILDRLTQCDDRIWACLSCKNMFRIVLKRNIRTNTYRLHDAKRLSADRDDDEEHDIFDDSSDEDWDPEADD